MIIFGFYLWIILIDNFHLIILIFVADYFGGLLIQIIFDDLNLCHFEKYFLNYLFEIFFLQLYIFHISIRRCIDLFTSDIEEDHSQ